MPGFDRTGPTGRGPLTGRGLGPCGRGLRRFLGWGRPLSKKEQREDLKDYKETLQEELKEVENLERELK